MKNLNQLFNQIQSDWNQNLNLQSPLSEDKLRLIPNELAVFYEHTNGASFPFGEIFSFENIDFKRFAPDFICFGKGEFEFYICNTKQNHNKFIAWDHESGSKVEEPLFSNITSFLIDLYETFIDFDFDCTVNISNIGKVPKIDIIKNIKTICPSSSAEILKSLSNLPLSIICKSADGIKVVRNLNGLNAEAHMEYNAPYYLDNFFKK